MDCYPIVFRCSECTIEAQNLDLLETHIWSRHLRSFPFHCSLCAYPALNHGALIAHFEASHADVPVVQFTRKITEEVKVREIVASSIVVPVYEDDVDEEQMFDQGQVPQAMNGGNEHNMVISMDGGMQMVHHHNQMGAHSQVEEQHEQMNNGQEHIIEEELTQEDEEGNIIYMDVKPSLDAYGKVQHHQMQLIEDDIHHMNMQHTHTVTGHNGVVMPVLDDVTGGGGGGDLMDDDNSYAVYSGHDLLDEAYEYVDEEGNTIYVTDQYPTTSKSQRNMRLRVLKDRHLDLIVNRVASDGKRRRAGTVWQCPDCGKVVRYPSRIEEHRRSHTGEKPHECQECGQKFSQKGALKCHIRTHTGERPYVCTWDCGKSFVSASAQRMHEKKHSGERPYACCICGRLFGKRSHLIRHEQAVHRAETIDPSRRPVARGLDAAGVDAPTLKGIVDGVLEEVRQERYERSLSIKKEIH